MIKYNLKCCNDHEFESWFSDSNEFDNLKKKNLLECIFCSSKEVNKSIMAPMVSSIKDNNIKINVALAKSSPIGVDTEEDFLAIKKIMEYKS